VHWNKKLGSGISGPVRICTNKVTRQHYALKCLLDRPKSRTEVELHYRCNHPNIVQVVDVYANETILPGELSPKSYLLMVMEFMEGGELFERIRKRVSFTEKEACDITKQIASGLGHVHQQNIAHRDLKPENLLLKSKVDAVFVKIADFGFAKEDKGDLMTPQFTPYYVSPQVLEAQKFHKAQKLGHIPADSPPYTYSKSCDMWSLGVIVYIMLCGYPPFYSENPRKQLSQGMRRRIMAGEYDFPHHEWGRVSDIAKDVVRRMLSVNPEERITIQQLLNHPWLNDGKAPNTPLQSPRHLMDEESFEAAMNAHSAILTDMRLPDHPFSLDSGSMSRNPIIQRRKAPDQGYESGGLSCSSTAKPENSNDNEEKVASIRDLIGYCYLAPNHASGISFEQELCSLAIKTIQLNPHLLPLHKALRIESFNGQVFMGQVNRKRLAGNLSDVLTWMAGISQ